MSGGLMGFFGKPADKVGADVRQNSILVDLFMKDVHPKTTKYGDFTFDYLYTSSEPISQSGNFGSVIYIKIESPVHEYVAVLPVDSKELQESIDKHQESFKILPPHLLKEKTRWLYFSMGTVFRSA